MEFNAFYAGRVVELADDSKRATVQLLRVGEWNHPQAADRKLRITTELLRELKENFESGCRGAELPTNFDHDDPTCANSPAWIQRMELSADGRELHGEVEVTDDDLREKIRSKKLRYFSPEIAFGWVDPETSTAKNVIKAAAWTNVPYIKNMAPAVMLNLSEVVLAEQEAGGGAPPPASKPDDKILSGSRAPGKAADSDAKNGLLPAQCASCQRLEDGSCPFPGIQIKIAAAGDGACPQYIPQDSQPDPNEALRDGGSESNLSEETMTEEENKRLADAESALKTANEQLAALGGTTAQVTTLSETVANLAEENRRLQARTRLGEDQLLVGKHVATGKITPAQSEIVLSIFRLDRGEEVLLADGAKASVRGELERLVESIDRQVDVGDPDDDAEVVQQRQPGDGDRGGAKLSDAERMLPKWTARAKELAANSGKPYTVFFSEAVRQVSAEEAQAQRTKNGRRA